MCEGIVTSTERPDAVRHTHSILSPTTMLFHAFPGTPCYSMADSASANPPSSGPMPSDLTGVCRFVSSISSSSDIQPSETMGVLSVDARLVWLDWSCVDIVARTSWYRSSLASCAGKTAGGAGVPFCGTSANISTR